MQNATYVLLDTTGAPGSNLLAATLTATTQFGVTTTAQIAWVFLPNPTYGYRIVNVSFPAKTFYGAGTVFCDVYNADGAGSACLCLKGPLWAPCAAQRVNGRARGPAGHGLS